MNQLNKLINIRISKRGRIIINILTGIITVGVLFYLLYSRWDSVKTFQWQLDWKLIALSILVYLVNILLLTWIWVRIVYKIGVRVNYFTHFKYYCYSQLLKRLPGTVWYVPFRARMYSDEGVTLAQVTVTSGIEFAIFITGTFLAVMVFSIPILKEYSYSIYISLIFLVLAILFLLPRTQAWIFRKVGITVEQYSRSFIYSLIFMSFIARVLSGLILYLICASITSTPAMYIPYVIGIHAITGLLSSMLFFSPNNLGFTEMTISLLLAKIIPSSVAVIVSIVNRLAIMVFEGIFALVIFLLSKLIRKPYSKGIIDSRE